MINVAVAGANGRMGALICKDVVEANDMELAVAMDVSGVGEKVGDLKIEDARRMDEIFEGLSPKADVYVDFTVADAAVENIETASRSGIDLVVGTTGFSKEQKEKIERAINGSVSAVISPNFSVGVNVFWKIVKEAAIHLKGYDAEIIESHHRFKKDSPSGTAKKAYDLLCEVWGEREPVYGRSGFSERKAEIGMHSIRAGDIVGDHTVLFGGEGERLEITHRAHSREAFASGVLRSIRWLSPSEGGREKKIYTMEDVLEL
ncbi:MAG: 4-hydroxy-tetrahydrodipicolinate reductase [Candidatus Methanolliviera hydrocarbonicum]|mgnify:CR=1 FL=1|jgi:dihydrodipicolinate reductase (EC 1.3.1.26)|uniref:4-hydroxy-tetrahydrodipicolinate reductase n=1 Tax=Candidatus Methanolliviera hydrocarbonicum TaxID=2491085 RepID=A0A520KYX3_9EURY|nr:MAG: 4-hydroxy-tetrahydrodipicolinate reductase [Candidatus Methanolliviera hydrocarbonicum]